MPEFFQEDNWIARLAGPIEEANTVQVIERLLTLESRWMGENEPVHELLGNLGANLTEKDPETWSKVKKALDEIEYGSCHFITLLVSSPGGEVGQALNICDTIKQIMCPLRVIGLQVYSAACLVVAGGPQGQRYALPNSKFYLHRLSGGVYEKYEEIVSFTEDLKRVNERMISVLSEYTGRKRTLIQKLINQSKWLDAQEALDLGLVDKILVN